MKKKVVIVLIILFAVIGIYSLVSINFKDSAVSSNFKRQLESEWNSAESVGRVKDSNEEISFKNIDILVTFNGKKIGDINAVNPLIINLSDDNIIMNNGVFLKSCNANFIKNIQQSFELNTDSTFIKTDIIGKIFYKINYEIKGDKDFEEAKEIFLNLIMKEIYTNAKGSIKFGVPEIKSSKSQPKKEIKYNTESLIKL